MAASEPFSLSPGGTSLAGSLSRWSLPTNDLLDAPASRGNPRRWNWPKLRQQRIVVLEVLAEAESRVEHDALPLSRRFERHLHAVGEIVLDLAQRCRHAGSRFRHSRGRPRVCISTTPHPQLGACSSHREIPLKAAYVVDDFRTRIHGLAARRPPYRCQPKARPPGRSLQQRLYDRHHAFQFFLRAHRRVWTRCVALQDRVPGRVDSPPISRMSAPSSSNRNACSTARSGAKYSPAVGKRIGRDVDDAHHERAAPSSRLLLSQTPE